MNIEVSDLQKTYGHHFDLRVPSLRIGEGETFGLVGNNGAGKTTFLRLLLDLIYADGGEVLLDGHPTAGRDDWKTGVGSYLDESFLLDFLTADEYFEFTGTTYGLSRADVAAALEPFRSFFTDRVLGERTRYLRDLSVGNKKKVGLVAALFVRPKLLILDEPFANLDPGSQMQLLKLLRELNAEHGTTMIISSHDLDHVTQACDRIAVLEDGQIVRDNATSEETLPDLKKYFEVRLDDALSPPSASPSARLAS